MKMEAPLRAKRIIKKNQTSLKSQKFHFRGFGFAYWFKGPERHSKFGQNRSYDKLVSQNAVKRD